MRAGDLIAVITLIFAWAASISIVFSTVKEIPNYFYLFFVPVVVLGISIILYQGRGKKGKKK